MSNLSHSSQSSRSSSQRRNNKRPQREKRKKNNSEDYDSPIDDDDLSQYDGMRMKNKQQPILGPKGFNKREAKLRKPISTQTPATATFLYKPGAELPNLSNYINSIIDIKIACEYINKNNPALILRQIWGSNGAYASHSDAVCIGIHAGLLALGDLKLTSAFYQGVSLSCKVIKGKKSLNGQMKVPLLSRSLKTPCAHCLKPEKVTWLPQLGSPEQLISWAKKMSLPQNRRLTKRSHSTVYLHEPPQISYPENLLVNNLPPLNEGWIVWDMCNEPSQKYNLLTFMDRQTAQGLPSRTSYKLKTHCLYCESVCIILFHGVIKFQNTKYKKIIKIMYFVKILLEEIYAVNNQHVYTSDNLRKLQQEMTNIFKKIKNAICFGRMVKMIYDYVYIETHNKKYEISMDSSKIAEEVFLDSHVFTIQEVLYPQQSDIEMLQKFGVPLPKEQKKVIFENLKWDTFEWGNDNVIINGSFEIQGLKSFKFVPITKHQHYEK